MAHWSLGCTLPVKPAPNLPTYRSTLRTAADHIRENFQELLQFLRSTSFSRAVMLAVAITVPIIVGMSLGHFEIGLALCYGAFWSSPSNISGSFRHKKYGILISAVLAMVVAFIGSHMHYETWLSLPVLGLLSFSIAYLSVYGFRATLISFSGLLALILSFALDPGDLEIHEFALLVGAGGLWYLLLAKIWHLLSAKAETEEFLSKAYALTAEFLELRGKLVGPQEEREKLQSELLNLQSALTENHETLRELLILSRSPSGWTDHQYKRLLIFAQLVDMLETAIANSGNYERMDALFRKQPRYVPVFQELFFEMSRQLRLLGESAAGKNELPSNDELEQTLGMDRLKNALREEELEQEEFFLLRNAIGYQEKQFEKLKRIKRLLSEAEPLDLEPIDHEYAQRFITTQNLDPRTLLRNFGFRSSIFRHSLRLAVTVMLGYALGLLFPFQNPYWILLTIIVIMRPSYGLTKRRAKDRMLGTLIGAIIATAVVFLIRDPYVYAALSVVSLIISISMVQKNFRAASIFVTLAVIFLYAIIQPDILNGIKFRILDTIVAAVLAYAAMRWLWPTWEFVEISGSVEKSVKANSFFFQKIAQHYREKGKLPSSYNIARKEAFLATSNLNLAFQRMAQEPRSKQKKIDEVYDLVILNHAFLASLASLSIYIQHNSTTAASEQFNITTARIERNLEQALRCLGGQPNDAGEASTTEQPDHEEQLLVFNYLELSKLAFDKENLHELQEAHLVWEQLQWLYSISAKMLKLAGSVKLDR